ncbi:MAG TPA: hypothetical protein VH143_07125 [Kofleriaceae bacterium]|jgi:hypothetical protein|nr:hypothetical protein [Kofleriaceae bacterium]
MSYRDDVDALAARHIALEHELADKSREVADAARILDEARSAATFTEKAPRSLPMLDNLRVATPCRANWDRMLGDDRVRHCNDCNKNVFNLSAMTRDQAEALIVAKNGDLCARYYQRADGTILLSDCTVGVSQRNKRRLVAAGALALLAGTSVAAAMEKHKSNDFTMGDVRVNTTMQFSKPPIVMPAPVALDPKPMPLMGAVAFPSNPPLHPLMGKIAVSKKP